MEIQDKVSVLILIYFCLQYSTFVLPLILGFVLGNVFILYYTLDKKLLFKLLVDCFVKHLGVFPIDLSTMSRNPS